MAMRQKKVESRKSLFLIDYFKSEDALILKLSVNKREQERVHASTYWLTLQVTFWTLSQNKGRETQSSSPTQLAGAQLLGPASAASQGLVSSKGESAAKEEFEFRHFNIARKYSS